MLEVNNAINSIENADNKLDVNNSIDERKIINKIENTKDYFDKFESENLVNLKSKLDPENYEKLEIEFIKLKK